MRGVPAGGRFLAPYRPKNTTSRPPAPPFQPGHPFRRDPIPGTSPTINVFWKGKGKGVLAREGVPACPISEESDGKIALRIFQGLLFNNLEKCPVEQRQDGHFQYFKIILASEGCLIKKTLKDFWGESGRMTG